MNIGGFIVTDMAGNPAQLNQKKVIALRDYRPGNDDVIVVSLAQNLHQDVSDNLKKAALLHYLYANDTLKGPF